VISAAVTRRQFIGSLALLMAACAWTCARDSTPFVLAPQTMTRPPRVPPLRAWDAAEIARQARWAG